MSVKSCEKVEKSQVALTIEVGAAEFEAAIEKAYQKMRKKINVPGFRPGMVPMSIISRMYRKGVVAETAYKMASDACFDYIAKEQIDYMGDVLPSDEQGAFDFDNASEHEFVFSIGLAPKVDIELTDKDKITRYVIEPPKDMRDAIRSNFLRTYGRLVDVDAVASDEALTGVLDNGELKADDAYVGLISMSDEERKPFIGKKVGDQMIVNINELYKTASQRASVLGVKENELADVKPEFNFTIKQIRKYADPEMNEEFFKTAFPDGKITTVEAFEAMIDQKDADELKKESDYVFQNQLRDYLVKKAALTLPE